MQKNVSEVGKNWYLAKSARAEGLSGPRGAGFLEKLTQHPLHTVPDQHVEVLPGSTACPVLKIAKVVSRWETVEWKGSPYVLISVHI